MYNNRDNSAGQISVQGDTVVNQQSQTPLNLTLLTVEDEGKVATKVRGKDGANAYDHVKYWYAQTKYVKNIRELSKLLNFIEGMPLICVTRAAPRPGLDLSAPIRRLIHDNGADAATLQPCARQWICIDIDGVEAPEGIDPAIDPGGAAKYVVKMCLPGEFSQATVHYQFSSSQGFKNGKLCIHLWFFLNQTVDDKMLKHYFKALKKDYPDIDPSLFDGGHIHYTARPVFKDGVKDPLPGDLRSGLVPGEYESVQLPPIATLIPADDTAFIAGSEYRPGAGFQGFLDGIGSDREGFHVPIRGAVASFVATHGPDGDWQSAKVAIRQAVDDAISRAGRGGRPEKYLEDKVSDISLDADRQDCLRKFVHTPGTHHGSLPGIESRLISSVVPPDYNPICVEEARRKSAAARARWFENPLSPRFRVEAGDAGLGKSTSAVRDACSFVRAERVRWRKNGTHDEPKVNFYVDKIVMAQELSARCTEPTIVIRGRNADTCKKYSEIEVALAKIPGLPVMSSFCKKGESCCEHYAECPYIAQFQSKANIRFLTIDHAHYDRGEFGLNHADLYVLDEKDRAATLLETPDLDKVLKTAGEARPVIDIIEKTPHKGVQAALLEAGWDYDRLCDARKELDRKSRPKLSPTMTTEERSRELKKYRPVPAIQILKTLEHEIGIPRRNGFMGVENIHGKIHVRRRRGLYINERCKVLVLNATAKRDQAAVLYPGCEYERIEVRDNLHLTQIYGSSYSRYHFTDEKHSAVHIHKMQLDIDTIAHIERRKGNGRVLFVTYKRIKNRFKIPEGCEIVHFGELRGLNKYEDFDAVCVIGRNETKPVDVEDIARALHFDCSEEIQPLPEDGYYPNEVRPFIMRDGSAIGIAIPCHPDSRVQSELETIREDETVQAIGRIRPINSPTQKRAYIFGEIPIRLPVDELLPKSVFDDVWTHVATMLDGVVPMRSAFLAERFPEVFKNAKAAEDQIRALRFLEPEKSNISLIGQSGFKHPTLTLGFREARFRKEGQRGRSSVVWTMLDPAETNALLEEWFGPLAHFSELAATSAAITIPKKPQLKLDPTIQADIDAADAARARKKRNKVIHIKPNDVQLVDMPSAAKQREVFDLVLRDEQFAKDVTERMANSGFCRKQAESRVMLTILSRYSESTIAEALDALHADYFRSWDDSEETNAPDLGSISNLEHTFRGFWDQLAG